MSSELRLCDRRAWLIVLALVAAVFTVCAGVGQFQFANYDGPDCVTDNLVVNAGLSLRGVWWALTTGHASNWHPPTWRQMHIYHDVKTLGRDPLVKNPDCWLALRQLERRDEAVPHLRAALRLQPDYLQAHAQLAELKTQGVVSDK